jgi:flagellar FliL protein
MSDRRVVARPPVIHAPEAPRAPEDAAPLAAAAKGRRRLVLVAIVAVLALGAAAFVFLKPAPDAAEAGPEGPVPGAVVAVDPVSVNLADGHYLRLGFSMQLTESAHEEIQQAQALDIAIALFTGRRMAEVNDAARREELKVELAHQLAEAYEGEVMDVYLTDFVTQ